MRAGGNDRVFGPPARPAYTSLSRPRRRPGLQLFPAEPVVLEDARTNALDPGHPRSRVSLVSWNFGLSRPVDHDWAHPKTTSICRRLFPARLNVGISRLLAIHGRRWPIYVSGQARTPLPIFWSAPVHHHALRRAGWLAYDRDNAEVSAASNVDLSGHRLLSPAVVNRSLANARNDGRGPSFRLEVGFLQ